MGVDVSQDEEYQSIEQISKSTKLIGTLDIFSYLQPTTDLYLETRGKPVGRFTYNLEMTREPNQSIRSTRYPFIWRSDGPVELDQYFGY